MLRYSGGTLNYINAKTKSINASGKGSLPSLCVLNDLIDLVSFSV